MTQRNKIFLFFFFIPLFTLFILSQIKNKKAHNLPVIAIANYGPHTSLFDIISGLKQELEKEGYIENETIVFLQQHVNFDNSLIAQMLLALNTQNPKVLVTLSTPVTQRAKGKITSGRGRCGGRVGSGR